MHDYCLNMVCPPTVEEKLLDVLLVSHGADVFTTVHVHSHGIANGQLSAQEQVMGRSQATHIRVLMTQEAMTSLLERIRNDFAGTGIRYWASPVAFEGEIE